MTLAHLHMQPCRCTRCGVARNYARLLAARTLKDEADAAHTVASDRVVVYTQAERLHLDPMAHA